MNQSSLYISHFSSNRYQRLECSKHATKRCQQRGIRAAWVPLIKAFGRRDYDGHGTVRYLMTKDSMDRLLYSCGPSTSLQALRGTYIVVSVMDGTVITVAHFHH